MLKWQGGCAATEAAAGSFIVCGPSGPGKWRFGRHARRVFVYEARATWTAAGGRKGPCRMSDPVAASLRRRPAPIALRQLLVPAAG